jgi:uridine kinase
VIDGDEVVKSIIESSGNSNICIAGFAACGKTTISENIQNMGEHKVVHAEHWFYDYKSNRFPQLSGANPLRYDLKMASYDISKIIEGEQVSLGEYNHQTRGFEKFKKFKTNKILIFDGTIFSLEQFAKFYNKAFFFKPADNKDWLEFAAKRDVEERGFNIEDALKKNLKKLDDMNMLYTNFSSNLVNVTVHYFDNKIYYSL